MVSIEFCDAFKELFKKTPDSLIFRFEPDHRSIKNLIEHVGIPHSEIGSIHVNGLEVPFSYRPVAEDCIYIRLLDGPVDVSQPTLLRPLAYKPNRYIVDECVASLAPKLRMLGCDVVSDRNLDDQDIAEISSHDQRIVLTRDRGLLMRKEVVWGHYVRAQNPLEQIKEIIHKFAVFPLDNALQRCLVCNGPLVSVAKAEILHLLEPKTQQYFDDFSQCSQCHKVYWEGSHFDKMRKTLEDLYQV